MEITIEKKENCVTELKITLPAQRIAEEVEKKYQRLGKTAQIPGFRAGKAPKHLLVTYYGSKVQQEAVEQLVSDTYNEAIKEKEIAPIAPPKIGQIEYKEGQPLSFVATVETTPEVKVEEYKRIKAEKKIVKITDKEVNDALCDLQEKHKELVVVDEGEVEKGQMVIIDLESFKDNVPVPNGRKENFLLEVGKGQFLLPFEEELVGLEKGQVKEFDILIPTDLAGTDLAGQKVHFKVRLKEIKRKILPPLDDEFAEDIGDFNNLDELKQALRADLHRAVEFEINKDMKNQILEALLSKATVSMPDSLVEDEVKYLILNMGYNLAQQGVKIKKENIDENLKQEFRPEAIVRIKRALILEAIADKENITVEEDEYKEWIVNLYRGKPEKIRMSLEHKDKKAALMEELRHEKTLNFLLENADIKEVK